MCPALSGLNLNFSFGNKRTGLYDQVLAQNGLRLASESRSKGCGMGFGHERLDVNYAAIGDVRRVYPGTIPIPIATPTSTSAGNER